MLRRRKYSDEQIAEAVKNNITYSGALKDLMVRASGSNYKTLKMKIKILGLNADQAREKEME